VTAGLAPTSRLISSVSGRYAACSSLKTTVLKEATLDTSSLQGSVENTDLNDRVAVPRERIIAALLAAGFGLILLYAVGFAEMELLHNAAHDTRHAAGFPCH
jgi:cobalt transporter subunit CbtB